MLELPFANVNSGGGGILRVKGHLNLEVAAFASSHPVDVH